MATVLEAIPNVGASIARDLRSIGIKQPQDLIGRDPHSLYQALCDRTRSRQDPCVLDTFISAVRFMEGAPARPWWSYTAERKEIPRSNLGTREAEIRRVTFREAMEGRAMPGRPSREEFALEIRETDVAVGEKAEAPAFGDCYLGDLAPLAADGDMGTEED